MRRLLSIILALIMLCIMVPDAAFAEPSESMEGNSLAEQSASDEHATTESEKQNTEKAAEAEKTDSLNEENESGAKATAQTHDVADTPNPTETQQSSETPKPEPILTAKGGTFEADGKKHSVTATLQNGEGYLVMFSKDNGKSWTTDVPYLIDAGKLTVKVKAVKSGEKDVLCDDVTLEVKEPEKDAMLVATGGSFSYDGKAHAVSAKVENGTGYTIEYSTDGNSWSKDAPSLTKTGKLTVKIRAQKSGAETLNSEVTLEITAKKVQIVTIVNCKNSVNVRKGPGSNTAKIGNAPKGASYTLLEVSGNWHKIQYKSNVTGYVFIDYVKMGMGTPDDSDDSSIPDETGKIVTIVNCNIACNVRKGGSTSYAKIGTAVKGAKYQYLGKSGNYYKIQYTASTVGYVHKNYAKITTGSVSPDQDEQTDSKQIVTIINCKVNCNVRAKASQSSKKIGVAPRDKQYQYLGKSGSYYKIQYTKSQIGYVHVSYAKVEKGTVTPDSSAISSDQGKIVNCKTMVNVRAEASSASKLLGTLKLGATVNIVKTEGNWTKIKYNGSEAYVYSKYIKKD